MSDGHAFRPLCLARVREPLFRAGTKSNVEVPHGTATLNNKPIIITFLAMEKVILLCTCKTRFGEKGLQAMMKNVGFNIN